MVKRTVFLVLVGCFLGIIPLTYAQPGTEAQILTAVNQARSTNSLPPLTRDLSLDKLAIILLNNFDDQCNFDASQDAQLAATAGWTGNFEVVRECGINLLVNEVIGDFTAIQSTVTQAPIINNQTWNSVGLAADSQATNSGNPRHRYVMVLGAGTPTTAAIAAAPSFALETELLFPPLNLILIHPSTWTADQSNGLTLVQNAADLAAAADNDPATQAIAPYITLDAVPFAMAGLAPDATLEQADKLIRTSQGLTVQEFFDSGVMGYPARTLLVTDPNGYPGLVTFWLKDDNLAILAFSATTIEEAKAWLPNWQQVLNSIRPADALPLTQTIKSQFMQANVLYPAGWAFYDGTDRFGLFEQPGDYDLFVIGQNGFYTGIVITALFQPTEQVIAGGLLTSDNNLDELYALNIQFVGLQNPIQGRAFVFGQPAYTVEGMLPDGFSAFGVMGFVDGNVYFVLATAPNPQAIAQFKPTFHWMMQNFQRGN